MSSTTRARRLLAVLPSPRALVDLALAATALGATLVQLAHGGIGGLPPGPRLDAFRPGPGNLDVVGATLAAASTLPLVAWRRAPLGVLTATASGSVLLAALDYPLDLTLGPAVALYLLAANRAADAPWTPRTAIAVVGLFVAYVVAAAAAQGGFPNSELVHSGLAWAVAWFAGERTRLRRAHIAALQERAQRAEREVERERLLVAAEERARLARDLHDTAGHAISVIAVRAGAARLRHDEDPDRSRAALAEIEELARHTADEIDEIVGSLRRGDVVERADPPGDIAEPLAGLASLDALIRRHRAAGLAVTVDASGTPRPPVGPADTVDTADAGHPAGVAAYRILQESLTNAARHGSGRAHVVLAFGSTEIELTVTNPVRGQSEPRRRGGGHGLLGMRERANLLGGELTAERANGTFRVQARIPYGGRRA